MKKKMGIVVGIVGIVLIAAIGVAVTKVNADNNKESETQKQQEREVIITPVVNVDYASEELLADESLFEKYIDDDSEYQIMAAFTTNTTINNFRYVELEYKDTNQIISFSIAKELYSVEEFTTEKPVVIGLTLTGAIPNRGIAYTDEKGEEKIYSINMSGKDSSLLLTQITVDEED